MERIRAGLYSCPCIILIKNLIINQRELSSMDTHKGSVVALHAMKLSSGQHVVLSCSADHTICISFFAQDFSVQSVQQHNLGNAYGLCIAACELPLQGKESSSTGRDTLSCLLSSFYISHVFLIFCLDGLSRYFSSLFSLIFLLSLSS